MERIRAELLGSGSALDLAAAPKHGIGVESGGIVTFVGVVREDEEGTPLKGIDYEHHPDMCLPEMIRILQQAFERYSIQHVTCLHRTGFVPVGSPSVRIEVHAKHRKDAFLACEFVIDALKTSLPMWKTFIPVDQRKVICHAPKP